jgi:hypothetical protein
MLSRSHPGRNTGSGNPDLWSCRVLSAWVVSIELRCENACIITFQIITPTICFRTSLTVNTQ